MKTTLKKHLVGLLLGLTGWTTLGGVQAEPPRVSRENLDGIYASMPTKASDDDLMIQALASLLLGPVKFERAKISGKIERVQIRCAGDRLEVITYDSSGSSSISGDVVTRRTESNGTACYSWVSPWEMEGEVGGRGSTVTTLSLDRDGNLFAELTTTTFGTRILFFRTKDSVSKGWLKFTRVDRSKSQSQAF